MRAVRSQIGAQRIKAAPSRIDEVWLAPRLYFPSAVHEYPHHGLALILLRRITGFVHTFTSMRVQPSSSCAW
jgi:hypothetical protein